MRRFTAALVVPLFAAIAAIAPIAAPAARAQEASKEPEPLQVGAPAPDFTLPGATRYGMLRNPIHLSDFKGKTVVLAFFYKARTKG
jgi:thioredoxin-dependent peroxiredoxin